MREFLADDDVRYYFVNGHLAQFAYQIMLRAILLKVFGSKIVLVKRVQTKK
jgi:hypothetical protein